MANFPQSKLYYWDNSASRWFYVGVPSNAGVVNDSSGSALREIIIRDKLGQPRQAELFVVNRATTGHMAV